MSGFKLDFEHTFDGEIENGTYEVIITSTGEDATQSGAEFANFRLTIRNDIEQKHKNQNIFSRVFKKKADGTYPQVMFNTIGKAAQLQNGKTYNSLQELLDDYIGKPLKVTVKNETSEYNGKTYENLEVKRWMKTEFTNVQHVYKNNNQPDQQQQQQPQQPQVGKDDLPF